MTKPPGREPSFNPISLDELEKLAWHIATATIDDFSSDRDRYHWVAETAYDLGRRIDKADAHGIETDAIRRAILPALNVWCASPFMHRLRTWPRGYPGDFETIEYLCDGLNRAPPGTMAFHFEQFFLTTPPIFQHRFKIDAQANRITQTCLERSKASILVLAAGGGRDVQTAVEAIDRSKAEVTINDIDSDALTLCRRRFAKNNRLKFIHGNASLISFRQQRHSISSFAEDCLTTYKIHSYDAWFRRS